MIRVTEGDTECVFGGDDAGGRIKLRNGSWRRSQESMSVGRVDFL